MTISTPPNIVVLDGYTLNPGDLSWERLGTLGHLTVHDRTPPELTVTRAKDAAIVLTNKVILNGHAIAQLPDLRYIGVLATGHNVVDLAAAKQRNIPVTNVPAYGTRSVAQAVFALLLELTNSTGHYSTTVRQGRWSRSPDFCFCDSSLVELDGRTLGIIGLGRIGRAVAEIARAFGMKVVSHNPGAARNPVEGVTQVDLDTLFRISDVISLHCPLTDTNKGLINEAHLALMKPSAFLINTARGALINERDLANALNTNRIAGAGLDVLSVEPPHPDNPMLTAKNCIITPHIAWATHAARRRLMDVVVENVNSFLAGRTQNRVNP
jgi:glycerate dehydrogenase